MLSISELLARMDGAGIDRCALIATMMDPLPATPERLLALLRAMMDSPLRPLARILSERLYTDEGNLRLREKVYQIYSAPENEPVAAALRAHPDRFLGWIFLNPAGPTDPLVELERWRAQPGFFGVKLHPYWHRYSLAQAVPLARRCEELRMPMLIHLGFGEGGRWRLLADACPRLTMVFAHAAFPGYSASWRELRDHPRILVDISSPFLNEKMARRAVKALGAHRVLYGTDAPYGFLDQEHRYDYRHIKGWVERLSCPSRSIDAVLGGNMEELLSIA
jgi:predicted TIM-barrel fold metal-dependent hydrolase